MRTVSKILLASILLFSFILGLFLLIPFPLTIFQKIVNSQIYIQRKSDGELSLSTFMWSHLPATQLFHFYLWNLTNPDEVIYNGAVPSLVDVGPYTYAETEFKQFIKFRNDDNEVVYQNNKTWTFDKSKSCEDCNFEDVLIIANPSYMSLVAFQLQTPMSPAVVIGLNIFSLLLGELPFRTVSGSGLLYSGYSDPIIDLKNSQLAKTVLNIAGPALNFPDISDGGFFPHYNHTGDGTFTIKTGKDNTDNTALIQNWNGITHLPWWNTEQTRDIRNSGDGSFQKPGLKSTDKLKQFQSFACRTFDLYYEDKGETLSGIPTLKFKIADDTFDAIKNPGYRYENLERVNYFPAWPCGSNHSKQPNVKCAQTDCTKFDNFCSECCDGSHVDNTYVFPPGIIPQRCIPGKLELVPFGAFLSSPHFYGASDVVSSSLIGMHPDKNKHAPGHFLINPTTGSTLDGLFRMQFTFSVFNSPLWMLMSHAPNAMIPSFWVETTVETRPYALDFIRLGVVTIPNIIMGIGIILTAIPIISAFILSYFYCRRRKTECPIMTPIRRMINEKETAWITE